MYAVAVEVKREKEASEVIRSTNPRLLVVKRNDDDPLK